MESVRFVRESPIAPYPRSSAIIRLTFMTVRRREFSDNNSKCPDFIVFILRSVRKFSSFGFKINFLDFHIFDGGRGD